MNTLIKLLLLYPCSSKSLESDSSTLIAALFCPRLYIAHARNKNPRCWLLPSIIALSLNARTASQSASLAAIANAGSIPIRKFWLRDSARCAISAAAIIRPAAYKFEKLACSNSGLVLSIARDSV